MLPNDTATERADQLFRIGPETLVASSSSIVTGHISNYHKEVLKVSQPGPDGFPLEWKVTGELADPVTLKGAPVSGPLPFSKIEQAFMSPLPSPHPRWQQQYGELAPDGVAVLFSSGTAATDFQEVLPSAAGEQDLAALVKDIVNIQRLPDPKDRVARWLAYLSAGPSPEGHRVALRSLARDRAAWSQLEPVLRKLLNQANLSPDLRVFTFSFIAFNITQNTWEANNPAAMDLLCGTFSNQADPKLTLRSLRAFSILLQYVSEKPLPPPRQPLRDQAVRCLHRWASLGFANQELAEEYKRLSRQYALQ